MSRYDDIIHLPHHVSKTRKPMPLINRAAQFAPFAALTKDNHAGRWTKHLCIILDFLNQNCLF